MPHRPRSLALALAATAATAAAAPALAGAAAPAPTARVAATATCPIFTVVSNDPMAGFSAGRYHRLNFSPNIRTLTCDTTFHILRSYLYHPRSMQGWTAGPLTGNLSRALGRRFLKRGTNGRTGFDVWRFPATRRG